MRAHLTAIFCVFLLACSAQEMPAKRAPVRLEPAPDGDVAALVRARAENVTRAGGHLLVYVGASWCEPCQEFHKAAASGALDALFPGLVLLEFDADRDGERLASAGYTSELIPLFVRPAGDGSNSGRSTMGVRRGANAIEDLTPRLRELLK